MMYQNIGYHTRSDTNNSQKITGGSFGGKIDMETVNRLVAAHYSVKVLPSGRAVFVDRKNRDVQLYLTVNPASTWLGAEAIRVAREAATEKAQEREADLRSQLDDLLNGMSLEDAIQLLAADTAN